MMDCLVRLRLCWLALVLVSLPRPSLSLGNLFGRSECSERCGFLDLKVLMREGIPGSETCRESCVWTTFLRPRLECGSCSNSFDIGLDLIDIPTSDQRYFTEATAVWESVVTGDISGRQSISPPSSNIPGCKYPRYVDDMFFCAAYADIDGPLKIVGLAQVTYVRGLGNDVQLPLAGYMQFDKADVPMLIAEGKFGETVLHEFGHLIGIGSIWNELGLTGSSTPPCPYSGSRANAEYMTISGCPQVPIETDGRPGTVCSHWDEACLGGELMTGFIGNGTNTGILSRITIASLEDQGYKVDYSTAEPFGIADLGPGCACNATPPLRRLSQPNPTRARRRLSDESRQMAIDYGQSILLEQSQAYLNGKSDDEDEEDGVLFVGDRAVVVLIKEDGVIHDVVVTGKAES